MPQTFQVLCCASCRSFQVQQVKKSNKWICKLCGEKQSLLKIYGQGSGADCRSHVQKLNMMQGEMVLAAELAAGSFEGSEEPNDAHIAQTQTWNLQEMSPSGSRWEKYLENCSEGLSPEADDGGGSVFTTDRQQFLSDRKNAVRAHRKRKSGPASHGREAQNSPEGSGYQELKHIPNGAASSWEGSTAGSSQGQRDVAREYMGSPRELPSPGKNPQNVPPCKQPISSSSKWGRFLSPAESSGDSEELVNSMPSAEETQEASKQSGTSTPKALLQGGLQRVRKDDATSNTGDQNGKYPGNDRCLAEGHVFKPHTSLLGIQYPATVGSLTRSSLTGSLRDPLPTQQTWTGHTVVNEKPATPLVHCQLFNSPQSGPPVLPHAGSGTQGCLFQTDDDFDDDI